MRLNLLFILISFCVNAQNIVELGNDNTLTNVKISNKNLYVNNINKNVYSYTNVDKVINLSPLFETVKRFIEGINIQTDLKTEGLKIEYTKLKNDLENLSNASNGNHIELLDNVLKNFLSLYLNALKNGAININNNTGDAFVLFSDYQKNSSDFKIEQPVRGEFFLSNKVERNLEDKNNIFVYPYKEGMAIINNRNKFGFIDIYGNIIVDTEYDFVRNYSNGYAICYNGEFIYILNKKGEKLQNKNKLHVSSGETNFSDFNDGWFRIRGDFQIEIKANDSISTRDIVLTFENDKYNYYNEDFEVINRNNFYDDATDFCNGFALIKDNLVYKKIDAQGVVVKEYDSLITNVARNNNCLNVFYYNKSKNEKMSSSIYPYQSEPIIEIYDKEVKKTIYRFNRNNQTPILINATRKNNESLLEYKLLHKTLTQARLYNINYIQNNNYAIIKDESDNVLIKPFSNIIVLENDFFLYSSHKAENNSYIIKKDLWDNTDGRIIEKDNAFNLITYPSLGLIKPDSQVIISENENYNTLHSYNKKLFVFGKVSFSYDAKTKTFKENKKKKDGLRFFKNKFVDVQKSIEFSLIFVKYGLINSSGIVVLDMEYDDIKLISEKLVLTNKNGVIEKFYIDDYGNAILFEWNIL